MTQPVYNFGSTTGITLITPTAKTCGTVRDFVVLGGLSTNPYAIQWCAIGDPTDWPTPATDDARSKQSGQQVFPNRFGYITGIAGNDFYGYVFQENAITKMTYVGGDTVFSFDTFEEGRGCASYNAFARVDDAIFFRSNVGRHVLQNDQIGDIGFGKVDGSY